LNPRTAVVLYRDHLEHRPSSVVRLQTARQPQRRVPAGPLTKSPGTQPEVVTGGVVAAAPHAGIGRWSKRLAVSDPLDRAIGLLLGVSRVAGLVIADVEGVAGEGDGQRVE
jgi:hypothetical protein